MVVLNRIYTRTGDRATTALGTGERCQEIGVAHRGLWHGGRGQCGNRHRPAPYGRGGACHARPHAGDASRTISSTSGPISARPSAAWRLGRRAAAHRRRTRSTGWNAEIDALNAELAPLRSFVLPGGHPAAAHLHLARTVCRRAERAMVALKARSGRGRVGGGARYINRLSDFLFVASRFVNAKNTGDVLWVPGNRAIRAEPRCSFRCMTTPRCGSSGSSWSTVR